ncbi:PilW family protein [Vibrio sp. B1FLJ16]|uniref:PilW family protein n=1 Tax=Vibrio sp. B1FLJ16 TaxID=2751178 RepID=UPI0015F5C33A|nr:pilus assembly protein PilW [Vibrio sp. B1FLJ16]CAD7800510.1 pilus assembly protein PilW [Vibrio sp. B1FLJ16]CAE6888761.1 pilus assembly protein PilW [Vibrio sp. B1FLJ16]
MISQSVNKRYQRGGSLIELMVSSLIGLVLLGVIGSVFINLQKTAREKSLELHLLQGLNITLMLMKEDIQRAGYDGGNGDSLKLSGAAETITVSGGSSVGFVYFEEGSGYQHVEYQQAGNKLNFCIDSVVSQAQITALGEGVTCRSLFDENIFQVTQFTVSSGAVTNGSRKSAVTDVSLGLQTVDGELSKVAEFSIKQRNWQ